MYNWTHIHFLAVSAKRARSNDSPGAEAHPLPGLGFIIRSSIKPTAHSRTGAENTQDEPRASCSGMELVNALKRCFHEYRVCQRNTGIN